MRFLTSSGIPSTTTNQTGLNQTAGVSMTGWTKVFNLSPLKTVRTLFAHAATSGISDDLSGIRDGWGIRLTSGGQFEFHVGAAASKTSTSTALPRSLSADRWFHWAVTYDNSTGVTRMYINGELLAAPSNIGTPGTTNATTTTVVEYTAGWAGEDFDWRVFVDRVLSPDEVKATLDPRRVVPGVSARWFGPAFRAPGSSGTIVDESGNGVNLTASGIASRCIVGEEPRHYVFGLHRLPMLYANAAPTIIAPGTIAAALYHI